MTLYFADTSALAKRYIAEVGSNWIANEFEPKSGNIIIISNLALLEMRSLLARRRAEGTILPVGAIAAQWQLFLHAKNEYLTITIDDGLLNQAHTVVDKYTLRTLDGIQLACAIAAKSVLQASMTFLSADARLLAAAAQEGFSIDNPLNHP
jgi:hypothetical protein